MHALTRLRFFTVMICLAGLLLYLPGVKGPLLLDDKPALTENERVQINGAVMDEWRAAALSSSSGPLRRPIAMLSFAANYVLAGDFSAPWVKLVNLAIHLAISVLLYGVFLAVLTGSRLVSDTGTRRLVALTAAAIWFLHPLNVSTVLYAVQRMTQLSALFVAVGLLVFMHYRQRWAEKGPVLGEVLAAGLWLLLLTTLAVLSKENGALLPWLIVVLEVVVYRGVWADGTSRLLRLLAWTLLIAPVVLVVLGYVFSPELLQQGYAGREFTLEERLFTQARLLWHYLGWICLPNINAMGFHHDDIPLSTGLMSPLTTVLAVIGWLVLLTVAFLLRTRMPLLLLAVVFFLVGHAMESTVIPLEMVYEHRNYLPATMTCLALAYLLVVPASRSDRVGVKVPLLGVLSVLCLLLFVRVQAWTDEVRLSGVSLMNHPESPRSNHMYGNALLKRGQNAGLPELSQGERDELLLLSRNYFEKMYLADNRDVAALVMLFYLDTHYFSQLQSHVDWLSPLDELLLTRRLQATDWNALDLLFDLIGSNPAMISDARARALLDLLEARYPGSADVLRFRYQYLLRDVGDPAQLLPLLQQAQELAPHAGWVYHMLLREQARSQDVPGMYQSARAWLANDPNRYYIHQIKGLFGEVRPPAGKTDG